MALLVGPTGGGKTVLIKRLQAWKDLQKGVIADMPSSTPTVGTNLTSLSLNKRKEITIREVGGAMGPIWKNYYSDFKVILYVVDISNLHQVSSALVQLIDLVRDKNCSSARIILLFNKTDLTREEDREEYYSLFLHSDILNHAPNITSLEISCTSSLGLDKLVTFLDEYCS